MPNFMLLSTKNVEPCHTIIIVLQTEENLLLCPGSDNVEADDENYQKQWTGPMAFPTFSR